MTDGALSAEDRERARQIGRDLADWAQPAIDEFVQIAQEARTERFMEHRAEAGGLSVEDAKHFREMGRRMANWTPEALAHLERALDMVPRDVPRRSP